MGLEVGKRRPRRFGRDALVKPYDALLRDLTDGVERTVEGGLKIVTKPFYGVRVGGQQQFVILATGHGIGKGCPLGNGDRREFDRGSHLRLLHDVS